MAQKPNVLLFFQDGSDGLFHNRQTEFKVAEKDGILGFYDVLTPLYAHLHDDEHTFSLMWTEYSESFMDFYDEYLSNQEKYGNVRGVLSQPQTPPPPNAIRCPACHGLNFAILLCTVTKTNPTIFLLWKPGNFSTTPAARLCHFL